MILNDEFLLILKSSKIEKTNIRSVDIGEIKVSRCDLSRNLGVIFDKELSMKCTFLMFPRSPIFI